MTLGQKITDLRKAKGMTQQELADRLNTTKQTIGKYEKEIVTNLPLNRIRELAAALDCEPGYLTGWVDEAKAEGSAPSVTENFVTFPVIAETAAGYARFAEYEDYSAGEIDIPASWLKGRPMSDYFVIRVHGDSMFPAYQDGDLVLVLRQSTMNYSGQIGVVMYDDDKGTLKKVEYVMGEDWMRLVPINPAYPPVMVTDERLEHCRVLGIAKMVIREIR